MITEEYIREVLADVINEGYTSEESVHWIKDMLKDAWDSGYDKAWGMELDVQDENPYK